MGFLKNIGEFIVDIFKFFIKVFIVLFLVSVFIAAYSNGEISKIPNLAVIKLEGPIFDESKILKEIYDIQDNKNIKGVLLKIDSPGGALAPSFEISQAIKELKSKKPVVAYASGTMASGSYLSGVWATKIYANKGSFIGSIGVIVQGTNIKDLADKIGIKTQIVKAGDYKEAGTFMRKWSDEERQSLQNLVDKSYTIFINEVANARNLNIKDEKKWANARVFLADEAKNLGLIDDVSTYKQAKDLTQKLANVTEGIWKEDSKYEEFLNSISTKTANFILSEFMIKIK
ncbi:signal peptide peptidase SppA [Campylobacter sp. FMV-PI01]|uniref:Signal peptide peptidase SppA n=1 Tax=Campylobacter portucalensis TaxID=2608384 RepID=A0A6L5WIM5_9BACT|nr:signal peptide peptidase SppA [Campylobacter portucalensis]MSN97148.1 signal peptide peptidase SppA [Campylobacter portucalensis]